MTPPENAVHSLTVDLILRIRDFDGAGLTEISIPTRVEASRSFELDGNDVWHVTNDGGSHWHGYRTREMRQPQSI